MKVQEVINVDERDVVDLTIPVKPITIDLTEDDDQSNTSRRRRLPPPSPRQKVSINRRLHSVTDFGPKSSITIKRSSSSAPKAMLSRPSSSHGRPNAKRRKVEQSEPIQTFVLDDDDAEDISIIHDSLDAPNTFLELDSDGEDVTSKPKSPKSQEDDEEPYDWCHGLYDLICEDDTSSKWKPFEVNHNKFTSDITHPLKQLNVTDSATNLMHTHWRRQPNFSSQDIYPYTKLVPWKPARRYIVPPPRQLFTYSLPSRLRRPGTRRHIIQPMSRVASFKNAPGSVNRVEQSGPWIAIGSAAGGGHADSSTIGVIDPYNKDGVITLWNGKEEALPGHSRTKPNTATVPTHESLTKYYTVNDVNSRLVSAGNDKTVHMWTLNAETKTFDPDKTSIYQGPFLHPPTSLAFRSGTSTVAVAENFVSLFTKKEKKDHTMGAIAWGHGPSNNVVFASSEPIDHTKRIGFHKVIDADTKTILHEFDENGAGDELSITNDGTLPSTMVSYPFLTILGCMLALMTRGEERKHSLHLFDIRRSEPQAMRSLDLLAFPPDIEGEVNSAAFSPDNVYLAIGRNDNRIHVYDVRYLDRLLFDYEHHGTPRTNPGDDSYGVTKVQWVNEDFSHSILPFGLVTGGHDGKGANPPPGCVRYWNPLQADRNPKNGAILAEVNWDSSRSGDNSGEVTIFDFAAQGYNHIYR
ncbi:hypothetical protein H0H93_004031 [Arthromyces matolae]|nr:hypothetical protein H0H93_004031 [Arthromyces matolae]